MKAHDMMEHVDDEGKKILKMHKNENVDVLIIHGQAEMLCARVGGPDRMTDFTFGDVGGTAVYAAIGKRVAEASQNDLQQGVDLKKAVTRALNLAHNGGEIPWFKGFPRIDQQQMEKPSKLMAESKMADVIEEALEIFAKKGYSLSGALYSVTYLDSVERLGKKGTSWEGMQCLFDMAATDRNNTIETKILAVGAKLADLELKTLYDDAIAELELQEKLPLRDLPAGEYNTLFFAPAISHILEFTSWYGLHGGATDDYDTFTAGKRIGQRLFNKNITITDEPFNPRNPSPAPIDIFGVRKQSLDSFVREGVLEKRWYDFWAAQQNNRKPTGHSFSIGFGPSHLCLKPGDGPETEDEAIKKLGNGIYVKDLHYTRIENTNQGLFTGMTRYGTYLVEDGKVTARLPNLRFLDALPRMLQNTAWLSARDDLTFSNEFYGIRPAPVYIVPAFAQIDGFKVTGSTPLDQLK